MVGVPKSTGCAICRKRKIKCDETWPTCLNCQKNGKCCPGPPARHTFKDLGPRLNSNPNTVVVEDGPIIFDQPSRSLQHMQQLNEKYAENGSVTHKFRISHNRRRAATTPSSSRSVRSSPSTLSLSPPPSHPKSPLLRNPSPSQHHELARALVTATSTGSVGHRMSAFGPFIQEVPARIGHNVALDAAVACLVNAHSSLVHQKMGNDIVNIELYLRAVQTLQTSLEDPREGMSSNTLCASVLLGLVEALAGPRSGNRYLAHVGGAGRLMELLGPVKCQDPFAKELLRFNRGGIIITSIYERRPCFLTRPEWRDIAFDKTGLSPDDCVYTDMLHRMADFPALLNELKQLGEELGAPTDNFHFPDHTGGSVPDFPTNIDPMLEYLDELQPVDSPYSMSIHSTYSRPNRRSKLLERLQELKESLYSIGEHLNAKLIDGSAATELPSRDINCPIPTALHFDNWRVAVAYNCFWSLLILTNKVMMKILEPFDPMAYNLQAECRSISLEICKTWEHAWENKPIGAFHTGLSFVTAYEFCTPAVKEWILKGLNSLLDYQVVESFRWSEDVVKMMSGKLAGEGVDMVFSSVKTPR